MLEAIAGDTETEVRDFAITVRLYCLGLRVLGLCGLQLEETDLPRGTVWIRGKGRKERLRSAGPWTPKPQVARLGVLSSVPTLRNN